MGNGLPQRKHLLENMTIEETYEDDFEDYDDDDFEEDADDGSDEAQTVAVLPPKKRLPWSVITLAEIDCGDQLASGAMGSVRAGTWRGQMRVTGLDGLSV